MGQPIVQPKPDFCDLLKQAGCPPANTLMVRHADRKVGPHRLFQGWRNSHPFWETYYRVQVQLDKADERRFDNYRHIAMFIKAPGRYIGLRAHQWVTVFIGVWDMHGESRPGRSDECDRLKGESAEGQDYYPQDVLVATDRLRDHIGRTTVIWPKQELNWRRVASKYPFPLGTPLDTHCGPFPYRGEELPDFPRRAKAKI